MLIKIEEAYELITEGAACISNGPGCHPYHESWEMLHEGIRALGMAVLEESQVVEQYTCYVTCDHGEECRTTRRAALRDLIRAVGK